MSRKAKGINAERELVHKFWEVGWACIRIAGSGSSVYPSPDILAGNSLRKIAMECKTTKEDSKYFTKKEIDELREFAQRFGAESWVGIRFKKEWFFLTLEDLKETSASFVMTKENAQLRGLSFEELVK